MEIALWTVDAQAARAHRLEMRAAREECDVTACGREAASEVYADAAGSDDRDAHLSIS